MIVPNRFKVPEVLIGKKKPPIQFNKFLQRKESPNFNCIIFFLKLSEN